MSDVPGSSSTMHDVQSGRVEVRCLERGCDWRICYPIEEPKNLTGLSRRMIGEFKLHTAQTHE